MTVLISARNLRKEFKLHYKRPGLLASIKSVFKRNWQTKLAVKDLSLDICAGEIVGLVGANGAGKTTLVKMLSGIITPTSGQAKVLGHTPWHRNNEMRSQMSLIMGQKASLWWDLPAMDCYLLLKEIYQIQDEDFNERVDELALALNVKHLLTTQIRRLSLGERMKMELISALLHRPKVIFLDEPTLGLDLTSQKNIRTFLLSYQERFKPAMIITSHYMEDIQALCQRLILIKDGNFIYDGPLAEIRSKYAAHKYLTLHFDCPNPELELKELGSIIESDETSLKIKTTSDKLPRLTAMVLQSGLVKDLSIDEIDLGDMIESILKGKVANSRAEK